MSWCKKLSAGVLWRKHWIIVQGNRGIFGERNGIVVRLSSVTYIFSRHFFHQCSVIICNHALEQLQRFGFQTMGPLSPHCYKNSWLILDSKQWAHYRPTATKTVGAFWIPNNGPIIAPLLQKQLAHFGFQTMGPLSPHCYKNEPHIKTEGRYGSPSPELSTGEDWNSILDACDRSPSYITSLSLRIAPPVPFNETCGGPQKLSGRCGEEKIVWPSALYPDLQRRDDSLTAHPHLVPRFRMRGAVPTSSYILTTCLLIKCRQSGVFTFRLAELSKNIGLKFEASGLSILNMYNISVATELCAHTTPDT